MLSLKICIVVLFCSHSVMSATQEVCIGYDFSATCQSGEVILMESAEFGRMSGGKCLVEGSTNLGCTNDVIHLVDEWCSGKQSCEFDVPNEEIIEANTNCNKDFMLFFRATYTCIKVESNGGLSCSGRSPEALTLPKGILSNQIADKSGCGSLSAPWVIQADPGQTIQLELLDFSALQRSEAQQNLISCGYVHGYILEKSLNINQTICGQKQRESLIYTSKTSSVEIHIRRNSAYNFLLEYTVHGCSEPIPPPHAWYKRNGNEAVIGCESNNKQWQLTCSGNTWRGNVGNCSTSALSTTNEKKSSFQFEFSTVVIVAAIIGGTIVLAVGVTVCGTVYLHRYRDEQEKSHTETMTMKPNLQQIDTMRGMTMTHYRPVSSANPTSTEEYLLPGSNTLKPDDQHIHTWETAQPQPRGEGQGTVTTAGRHNAPMTGVAPGRNSLGNGTGRNEMRPNSGSYYSPNTGHKYYVLDREA